MVVCVPMLGVREAEPRLSSRLLPSLFPRALIGLFLHVLAILLGLIATLGVHLQHSLLPLLSINVVIVQKESSPLQPFLFHDLLLIFQVSTHLFLLLDFR